MVAFFMDVPQRMNTRVVGGDYRGKGFDFE